MLDDVLGASHHDGRDAACLQMPRHQADGLVADRTVRYQYRGIDMIGAAARQYFRRIGLNGYPVAAVGRRAEEARRELADPSLTRKFPQLWQWKPGSAVLGRGVHTIVGDMGNPQVMRLRT